MKKNTITTLALIAAFSITATSVQAQITKASKNDFKENIAVAEEVDDTKDLEEFLDRSIKDETVEFAQPEKQNIEIDYLAPLGGEILLLSCLGGAYLIGKKRKENK
jgi:hypothetical protein